MAIGLASPVPAISGAEPWTGSYSALRFPVFSSGAPSDAEGSASLERHWRRGARYYVHVRGVPLDAKLRAWLTTHGARISTTPAGELWQLRQAQP